MAIAEALSPPPSETSDLEGQLLAPQTTLPGLIAYMARREPEFLDHLRERFVEPMNTPRRKHAYRDSDDYAEEFIRAVMLLGEARAPWPWDSDMTVERPRSPKRSGLPGISTGRHARPDRVQVGERNGIWAVKVDGAFRGDYLRKEHALAAAALFRLSLR